MCVFMSMSYLDPFLAYLKSRVRIDWGDNLQSNPVLTVRCAARSHVFVVSFDDHHQLSYTNAVFGVDFHTQIMIQFSLL